MQLNGFLICLGTVILVGAGAVALTPKRQAAETPQYSEQESRTKLARIANALRLYREEVGFGPPETWMTPADAGLPPSILVLRQPGHPWSLPGGKNDLIFDHVWAKAGGCVFTHVFPISNLPLSSSEYWPPYMATLRRRAGMTPVLLDAWYGTGDRNKSLMPNQAGLVLRLNGQIDEVVYAPIPSTELLEK